MLLTLVSSWIFLTAMCQPTSAAKPPRPEKVVPPGDYPTLRVEGLWKVTEQDAWKSAEEQTQVALLESFHNQGLTLERTPPLRDLRPALARQGLEWKSTPETQPSSDEKVLMHRIVLEIPITPEVRALLLHHDREQRVKERMIWLGKILAGLVVLFAAGAVYFRLDEWTKGYYTTWLRVAAVGLVLATAVVLLL
jgi:hypothetical protein